MYTLNYKSVNLSGSSTINDTIVVSFSANYDQNNLNITKSINNPALYIANKTECDADEAAFEEDVMSSITPHNSTTEAED